MHLCIARSHVMTFLEIHNVFNDSIYILVLNEDNIVSQHSFTRIFSYILIHSITCMTAFLYSNVIVNIIKSSNIFYFNKQIYAFVVVCFCKNTIYFSSRNSKITIKKCPSMIFIPLNCYCFCLISARSCMHVGSVRE